MLCYAGVSGLPNVGNEFNAQIDGIQGQVHLYPNFVALLLRNPILAHATGSTIGL
jgi:hypothetical protein